MHEKWDAVYRGEIKRKKENGEGEREEKKKCKKIRIFCISLEGVKCIHIIKGRCVYISG